MTFLRIVTPRVFAFLPLDGGQPVWSRRADPLWLADQLAAEALRNRQLPLRDIRGIGRAEDGRDAG